MDYQKHYDLLIARGKRTLIHGYREKHHIIPRCMGGDNSEDNLVWLTAEEHYIAHQLLVKIYPDNHKLICAAILMTTDKFGNRVNNKLYGWLRKRVGEANKQLNLGKKMNQETKDKMSESRKGHIGYTTGMKFSEETKLKMSISAKGKVKSQSHRDALSESHKGKQFTEEHLLNMSLSKIGKTKSEESKKRMSDAKIGKTRSNETKANMRAAWVIRKQNNANRP